MLIVSICKISTFKLRILFSKLIYSALEFIQILDTKSNQQIVLSFQYSFGADPVTSLLDPLEEELLKTTHTYCGKSHPLFTKRLARSLANINRKAPRGR